MKKKIIGIPGYNYAGKGEHFGAGANHLQFISRFGNARIIMPWEEYVEGLDMLYLPGGLDTSPGNYGNSPEYKTTNQDVNKEFFYKHRLDKYIENNIPIFGVCLGSQMIAAKFGGKLTQDLVYHEQSSERWKTAHKISPFEADKKGNFTYGLKTLWTYNMSKYEVNSHHHQALTVEGLSDEIEPIFVTNNNDDFFTGDGDIIEAFKIRDRVIFGVQWHPEELYDVFSINIIRDILDLPPIVSKK